ncbi:MAG: hypothetical protein K9L70_00365 [Thiohalocapsa sp.]|jgi:hypothetical protein|nr:hypothetical protein [Thiohalocapsa sp.]MCF7991330.1 hypothetical protein [Thiohalocapsa sp.]
MELTDAIKLLVPLQVRMPQRTRPLQLCSHYAAEVFVVETVNGRGVVWVDPYWCDKPSDAVCHIAYARPAGDADDNRWIDRDPRYGPNCIPYQKPFVLERLTRESSTWNDYRSWQAWRAARGKACDRQAAWQRVRSELSHVVERRVA